MPRPETRESRSSEGLKPRTSPPVVVVLCWLWRVHFFFFFKKKFEIPITCGWEGSAGGINRNIKERGMRNEVKECFLPPSFPLKLI